MLALGKHDTHVGDILCVKIADVNRRDRATVEHVRHRGYFRGVETADNNAAQFEAIAEHTTHICNQVGVERTQIKTWQNIAVSEHLCHIGNLRRVQIGNALYACQFGKNVEPVGC